MAYETGIGDFKTTWVSVQELLPAEVPTAATPIAGLPPVQGEFAGAFAADWWMTSTGIALGNVTYDGKPAVGMPHCLAERLEWRDPQLIFDGATPVPPAKLTFGLAECREVLLLMGGTQGGHHTKRFSWGITAKFRLPNIADPRYPGARYTLHLTQSYLLAEPVEDVEPKAKVVGIKVFPTLSAMFLPNRFTGRPAPSFKASMKMVHAPRLTRTDQRRPPLFYKPDSVLPDRPDLENCNIVSLFSDTNDYSPWAFQFPHWHRIFEYVEPDLRTEQAFDAVVYPRSVTKVLPFEVTCGPSHAPTKITQHREPGQGEFDNVHIHPWVGFDDPAGEDKRGTQNLPLIEAPIAADEVIHLHWRWGTKLAEDADPQIKPHFLGYSDDNEPNQAAGRSGIPANQSLRIKVGRAHPPTAEDNAGAPTSVTPLDNGKTAIWYTPCAHAPAPGSLSMFFGHGYALGFLLRHLLPAGLVTNADLLGTAVAASTYHTFRWAGFSTNPYQRVPTASKVPGLSLNRLGVGTPPVDKQTM